jgi:capsular polysaccharide biosynthesis protein
MQILPKKILGFTFLLAGLVLCSLEFWIGLSPAQYQATTRIEVGYDLGYDVNESDNSPDYIKPTLERIQSPVVLSNVWKSLNLKAIGGNDMPKAIKFLHRQMNLQAIPNTTLIDISFLSSDPIEAAGIANAIAKTYSDYRMERWKQLTREVDRVLTEKYQRDEQAFKAKQENLEQLAKQLDLPDPEPSDELLKSNYPSYFETKRQLQNLIDFRKMVAAKIEDDKSTLQIPRILMVEIVDTAKSPKFPVSPNRWLGVALMVIGLFSTVGGFLLFKFSGHGSGCGVRHVAELFEPQARRYNVENGN